MTLNLGPAYFVVSECSVSAGGGTLANATTSTPTLTMTDADQVISATGSYHISSKSHWEAFCTEVTSGATYEGKTIYLEEDINGITTRTSKDKAFSGTFDGQGNTLNLNINVTTDEETCAPFGWIKDATIKNLHITGSETTAGKRYASIAGFAQNSTITNCWSEVALTSSRNGWINGGAFVGRVEKNSTLTLEGCVFTGSITHSSANGNDGGGMVGWTNGTTKVNNCLFAPRAYSSRSYTSLYMFVGGTVRGNITLTNCYFNDVAAATSVTKEGKQARSITAGDGVTALAISGDGTKYDVSGITIYGTGKGIKYNNTYYAGNGDEVSLTLNHADAAAGYTFSQYTCDNKVSFAQGNLQATYNGSAWTWAFAENQWEYIGNAAANNSISGSGTVSANGTVDLFGWSTSATYFGIHNSTNAGDYSGYFADWGANIGTGWRTLTKDEWLYIFESRSNTTVNGTENARYTKASVNGVNGTILFPDNYSGGTPSGVTWGDINLSNSGWTTTCTADGWASLEAAGCVFLPAAGYRQGTAMSHTQADCVYWTSTINSGNQCLDMYVYTGNTSAQSHNRNLGASVRLVNQAASSGLLSGRFSINSSTSGTLSAQTETSATLTMTDADQAIFAEYAPITSYDVTANSASEAYWATFYCNAGNYQAPEGTQVFTVKLDGTGITMNEIADRIAKSGQGVVLKKTTAGDFTMTLTETEATGDFDDNSLKGTMTQIKTTGENDYYVLGGKNGAGFYKLSNTNGTIGANKAYLTYPAAAREFFLFDETTGIVSMHHSECRMHNDVYDLQGRKLSNSKWANGQMDKGLYIVNGKKVFINK